MFGENNVKHTCAWYCDVMASFSCCRALRASCKATSFSDGPEDWGSVPCWASFSWDNNARREKTPFIKISHSTKHKYCSCVTYGQYFECYIWYAFNIYAKLNIKIIFYKVISRKTWQTQNGANVNPKTADHLVRPHLLSFWLLCFLIFATSRREKI